MKYQRAINSIVAVSALSLFSLVLAAGPALAGKAGTASSKQTQAPAVKQPPPVPPKTQGPPAGLPSGTPKLAHPPEGPPGGAGPGAAPGLAPDWTK